MMKIIFFFISVLFLMQSLLWGSTAPKSVSTLKTFDKIVIDGIMAEKIWQKSQPTSDFIQYEPSKGAPASWQTEVRVLYDSNYIYFGIACHDPEPQNIAARVSKREGEVSGDDAVAIALDTFNDGQTAYIFFTNLRGIQKDGRLADNGRTFDDTWDGKWLSAGAITENGWTAELAIPFETLKFNPGKKRTWGLGITRFIPRNMEIDTWSGPMESYLRVSQFGALIGLDLSKTGKRGQIIPHLITKIEKGKKIDIDAGLDMRYAFSQSVSADLTANPDFATVEADQEVINLTRFELSLKEKRNFFLEGAEIYQQRIQLRCTHLGENFADNANAVAFISDDDRHELDSAVEKTWWVRKGWLKRIGYVSNYNIYWGARGGVLRSWQIDQGLAVDLANKFSTGVEYTREFKHSRRYSLLKILLCSLKKGLKLVLH